MNISSKLKDEQIDPNKPPGGYEWWYFDALTVDKEWGIVIIFYQGNPFSPRYIMEEEGRIPENYPAISVSLYNKGKAKFYGFEEYTADQFEFESNPLSVSVSDNSFSRSKEGNRVLYTINLDMDLASGHSLNGELIFEQSSTSNELIEHNSETEKHFWNLLSPRSKVSGTLILNKNTLGLELDFDGIGYHDHNTGHEPMKDSFVDWYWGRIHFQHSTLIYYVMNTFDSKQYEAWLMDEENQEILSEFRTIELTHNQRSIFGLNTARKLIFESDDTQITLQHSKVIDNGPFYQRYISDAIMKSSGGLENSQGFGEYIKPERIYDRKYWWMVKMRLRFMDLKPHWVQRSKRMYEWTW